MNFGELLAGIIPIEAKEDNWTEAEWREALQASTQDIMQEILKGAENLPRLVSVTSGPPNPRGLTYMRMETTHAEFTITVSAERKSTRNVKPVEQEPPLFPMTSDEHKAAHRWPRR